MKPANVLVTGGTGGIGRAIAEALAARGAAVTITGRDPAKGLSLVDFWNRQGWDVRFFQADLGSQAGTLALAKEVLCTDRPLDVLVNNVGGVWPNQQFTPDGLEKTLAVNHVHPFLLSEALFPLLAAARGKVIHMNTGYHFLVRVRKIDWEQKRFDSGMNVYGRSKLISILCGLYLGELWARHRISIQFADPGMAWTPLTSRMGKEYFPWYGRFLVPAIHQVQKALPLAWSAAPAVSLAQDQDDRRWGVYAFPPQFRLRLTPAWGEKIRGRYFLGLTLGRWLTPEARDFIRSNRKGGAHGAECSDDDFPELS